MKNPWMSMWLSATNQATNTSRAFWYSEAARQQRQLVKAMTNAMVAGTPLGKPAARKTASHRSK